MEENSNTSQFDIKEFKNPDVDSSKNEIVNTIKELVPAKVFIVP